ncbi:MAG: glucose-6-phosphate isomerase family protein [Fimbriimonas sp.]|nr:glucose-6-phosphate isomerase family protein [Fimbriimonas sp.]
MSASQIPPILTNLTTGMLVGERIAESRRTVGDLVGYWSDPEAARQGGDALLYGTQTWMPAEDGVEGAILWGNTVLMPGSVGGEFFMTRGHWHEKLDRCEMCVTVSGSGLLVLMDESRNTWVEQMSPGSTHYVPGNLAHRTVNTGDEPLVFMCAWPADCGHNYGSILELGFGRRFFVGDQF